MDQVQVTLKPIVVRPLSLITHRTVLFCGMMAKIRTYIKTLRSV